ncbi:MAG: LytTR family DNA-binding domain-containing protein [Bacteroidota bacterium]
MIRTIIIDDEQHCIQTLLWQLEQMDNTIEIVATCNNAKEGVTAIKKLNPDLIFLDIEMPQINGFQLIKQFEKVDFEIIFTTAYDQYAVEAFRISAMDYLLKPIRSDHLKEALERILQKSTNLIQDKVDILMHNFEAQSSGKKKLALPSMDGLEFIQIEDIMYCEAVRNYTKLVMTNGKKSIASKTLKEIEKILLIHDFCRVHKTYLINLRHVKKYMRGDGGYAVMVDDTAINISRNRKDAFLQSFSRI